MAELNKGLKGGKKQMFNREHEDLILGCSQVIGDEKTMEIFNLKRDTLDRVKGSRKGSTTVEYRALGIAKIADERSLEAIRAVNDLKEQYHRFVPYLGEELTKKFFIPLIQKLIDIPSELEVKEKPDIISLTELPTPPKGKKNN